MNRGAKMNDLQKKKDFLDGYYQGYNDALKKIRHAIEEQLKIMDTPFFKGKAKGEGELENPVEVPK